MKRYFLPLSILTILLICAPSQGDEMDNKVQANEQLGLTGNPNPEDVPFVSSDFVSPDPKPEVRPEPKAPVNAWEAHSNYMYGRPSASYGKEEGYGALESFFFDWGESGMPPPSMIIPELDDTARAIDAENATHENVPEVGDLGGPVQEIM